MTLTIRNSRGFTLVELVLVIVIIGILSTIAFRAGSHIYDKAKVEQTRQELDDIANAIVGNPDLESNGIRSDFGYVGDVGSLPPDLDALVSNPGGLGTWKGPYFMRRFSQIVDDHKKDAWGDNYVYSAGVTVKSVGKTVAGGGCGGPTTANDIVRRLAGSVADLISNQVSGVIYDLDGTPPGTVYRDSVRVRLTFPDGSGSYTTTVAAPDAGGYFSFNSIPIGNHSLEVIYLPDADTLKHFVSVIPDSAPYHEYRLSSNLWYDKTGGGGP